MLEKAKRQFTGAVIFSVIALMSQFLVLLVMGQLGNCVLLLLSC